MNGTLEYGWYYSSERVGLNTVCWCKGQIISTCYMKKPYRLLNLHSDRSAFVSFLRRHTQGKPGMLIAFLISWAWELSWNTKEFNCFCCVCKFSRYHGHKKSKSLEFGKLKEGGFMVPQPVFALPFMRLPYPGLRCIWFPPACTVLFIFI